MRRLLVVSRPVLWVNTVGPAIVAVWLTGTLWSWDALPLLLWLTLPFNLLIYGVNDVFDQETDRLNDRKGGFGGARITEHDVKRIWWGVMLSNAPFLVWFAITLPPAALAWIAAYCLVFVFYSAPPLRFKTRPVLDSVSNAAYAFPLAIVPLALGNEPVWLALAGLMTWSLAKHTYDAIQDIDEDRATGIQTTAVRFGVAGSLWWASAWWAVASVCFAILNVWVGLANAAYAAGLVWMMRRDQTPRNARQLYRFSVAYPYVVGSVAGTLLTLSVYFGWYLP